MPNDFDRRNFSVSIICGAFFTGGAKGPTGVSLAVRVLGDGEITVALVLEQKGREVFAILGASGWPALLDAVREAEKRISQLRAEGRAGELDVMR